MIRLTSFLLCCASLLVQAPSFAQTPGTIQTIAGSGAQTFTGDGAPANQAALNVPVDVFADQAGNLFIADQFNNRIRKVASDGTISTVAGTGVAGFAGDGGPAINAQINTPTGIRGDSSGNLYIADVGNQRIRKVDSSGVITTFAGNGNKGYGGDGGPAIDASFYNAVRVAIDPSGNVLVADQSDHRIRRITPAGIVSTFAGNGAGTPSAGAFSGDGGPAVDASLNNPTAVAVDGTGVVYISDQANQRIRKVALDGTITTIAGNGSQGFGGDGGPASAAILNYPGGIIVDSSGNLYFNDDINYRTRMIAANGTISTIAGSGSQGFSGDGGAATAASLNGNFGVSLDLLGNMYIADSTNNRIREVYAAVPGATPVISSAAFTNAASFTSGGSPGAIATLFGAHLSRNLIGVVSSPSVPLSGTLAGTTVTVDGKTAPLFNVVDLNGKEQISFQVPVDAATGSAVPVVLNNGFGSATVQVTLAPEQLGIFTIDGTQAAARHADYSLLSTASPAAPGETILVYCTGLGAMNPAVPTGEAASNTVLSKTVMTYTATIAGQSATVVFSGLAPGSVGEGQVNLTVPAGAPSGLQDLVLTGGGSTSNVVKIQVQ
jgi:uncharacterized protein (TIGR03437 family)